MKQAVNDMQLVMYKYRNERERLDIELIELKAKRDQCRAIESDLIDLISKTEERL